MVRSVGVDPGEAMVKVVELDGSYRKLRLVQVHTEPTVAGLPKAGVVATAVRAAIDAGMKGEVRLGHPCREAVLRTLELPFTGKDAIRKVVKSEVEGEIHGHAVDDMVVDFHEIGGALAGGSRVIVAAVPKDGLRAQLGALAAASIEPETVDLDTMALWRAADWAGAFEGGGTDGVTAVVDVGARSVKVLLLSGGQLVDMRALRLGDASICDDIAMRHGLPYDSAREALEGCAQSNAPFELEVAEELPAAVGGEEEPAATAEAGAEPEASAVAMRSVVVTPAEIETARAAFLQRLQRELVRYLTASGRGAVDKVWFTGGASRMSGLGAVLAASFGVEPRELDLLSGLQHDLDDDAVAELGPRLATAIGLALTPMGGPAGFDLRREDLAFTRGFERIKFPLTIALMVALLALFVYGNHQAAKLNNLELQIGKTYLGERNRVDFFGMLHTVLAGKWFEKPRNFLYEQSKGRDYKWKDLRDELVEKPVHERIRLVRDKLKLVSNQKQKESGIYEDVTLDSGYAVLVRFSELMTALEPQIRGYLLTRIDLDMKAPKRTLKFTVAFRGEGFRNRFGLLEQALQAEIGKPDSPFMLPEKASARDGVKTEIFRDTEKTGIVGAYYVVTVNIKESILPFGAGASGGK